MRFLSVLLMMLALVSAVQAEVVLLSEDFDGPGAVAGNSINGYNGWSGHDTMVFTDTVIDAGLSAGATDSVAWPNVAKGFSYTPAAGETYTLTATLSISDSSQYASVEMDMGGIMPIYAGLGASSIGRLEFGFYNVPDWSTFINIETTDYTIGTVIDVMAVLTNGNADCYFRTHGAADWTLVGSLTDSAIVLADFNRIKVSNRGGSFIGGRTDSILLTADVPEPATLSLLAIGCVAIMNRRRR